MMFDASRLDELSVFAGVDEDPVVKAFFELIKAHAYGKEEAEVRRKSAAFTAGLYKANMQDWTEYFSDRVLSMDTCLAHFAAKDAEIPRLMLDSAMAELELLSNVASMSWDLFFDDAWLAKWYSHKIDLQAEYLNRLIHVSQYGFGKFASNVMFRLQEGQDGERLIVPLSHPDPVRFEDLHGYQAQHEQVMENTKILLDGSIASNILLYGDAGTGKSATVKATINALADEGLRLIEVPKNQLRLLPGLLDELSINPLKFVIFIDDLSFQQDDDDFAALKAVLEGSASVRSRNTVIYATTNRRHLVKETFSARTGDDIHRNDSMQETISLSERFGMKVLFEKPNAQTYFDIVQSLAKQAGLNIDKEELRSLAEQFALRKSGRSARAARQLVEQLAAKAKRGSAC